MEAAVAIDLPFSGWSDVTDLGADGGRRSPVQSARQANRARAGDSHSLRHVRLGRISAWPPLVPGRTVRPVAARMRAADKPRDDHGMPGFPAWQPVSGHWRIAPAHLLAERIQPDPRTVPPDPLRRRPHRQRSPVPVHVLDGRAWGASVLRLTKAYVTGMARAAVLKHREEIQ